MRQSFLSEEALSLDASRVWAAVWLGIFALALYFGSAGSGVFRRLTLQLEPAAYLPLTRR